MKKIALLLVATLTVASLAVACGSKDDDDTTTKATTTEAKTEEKTTEETTTEAPTEAYDDTKVEATGWWVAHSKAFEVTADGITVTFKSVTDEAAASNWNTPIYVAYGADEAFKGGAGIATTPGYTEAFVMRSDNYGWAPANANGVTGDVNTGAALDNFTAAGFTTSAENAPADDAAWKTWLDANKAGVTVTLTAKIDGENVVVTFENNGLKSTTSIPVAMFAGKTPYVSVSGELCTLTEIAAK